MDYDHGSPVQLAVWGEEGSETTAQKRPFFCPEDFSDASTTKFRPPALRSLWSRERRTFALGPWGSAKNASFWTLTESRFRDTVLWNGSGGPYSRWPSGPYDSAPFPYKNWALVGSRGGGGLGREKGVPFAAAALWCHVSRPPPFSEWPLLYLSFRRMVHTVRRTNPPRAPLSAYVFVCDKGGG